MRLGTLFRSATHPFDYLSGAPLRLGFKNARSALVHGISSLSGSKRKRVLVPSYNCGEELEAIVHTGCSLDFYRVDRWCNSDLGDLAQRIDGETLAVLVTHFNGFPQPVGEIRRLCREHGAFVIEDCAHVLKTKSADGNLGTLGDFAIFSPRKFLPIRNGGLLVINDAEIAANLNVPFQDGAGLGSDLVAMAKTWLKDHIVGNHAEALASASSPDEEIHDFGAQDYMSRISPLSGHVLERTDLVATAAQRSRNHSHLADELSDTAGLRAVQGPLPAATCPLFFLAEVADPRRMSRFLLSRSIGSVVFWSYFHREFPFGQQLDSEQLKRHVIALPIHQDLEPGDIDLVARTVKEYLEQ